MKAKPFVKWVGGKTQLIDQLEALLPADFDKWENKCGNPYRRLPADTYQSERQNAFLFRPALPPIEQHKQFQRLHERSVQRPRSKASKRIL